MPKARHLRGLPDRRRGAKPLSGTKTNEKVMTRCLGPLHDDIFYFPGSGRPGDRFCPECREAVKTIHEPRTFQVQMES